MSERATTGVMGSFCAQSGGRLDARAVEIAALFDDTIMDVRYLGDHASAYTIGEQVGVSFHVRSLAAAARPFELVRTAGSAHALRFTDEMRGDVRIGSETITLSELRARGGLSEANAFAWTIPEGASCRVAIGNNEFFVRAVEPLERQPSTVRIDWREQSYLMAVTAAAILFLVFAWVTPPRAQSLSVNDLLQDEHFLSIVVKPPEEKILQDARAGNSPAAPGAARHSGENGEHGDPKVLAHHARYQQVGPKDNPNPQLARGQAEAAAKNTGILGVLKASENSMVGGAFADEHALGDATQNVMGNLTGNEVGAASGYVDSLGDHGHGPGGGGHDDTVGVALAGRIGAGPGGPDGHGYGSCRGCAIALAPHRPHGPEVQMATNVFVPNYDKALIRRVVRQHMNEIKFCYEKELLAHPDLDGRVTVAFTFSSEGRVVSSVVQQSTLGSAAAASCMAQAVGRWEFPKPQNGGLVSVSYPFVLKAAGGT